MTCTIASPPSPLASLCFRNDYAYVAAHDVCMALCCSLTLLQYADCHCHWKASIINEKIVLYRLSQLKHTQTQLWCENLCWCWKVFFAVPFWVLINVGAGCKIVRWSFKMNQVRSLRWYDCGGLWLQKLISDCEHAISLSFKLSEEFSRRQNS